MTTLTKIFNPTVGRKALMAMTGLFLCMFLIEHLYGNLMMLYNDGGEAFNKYTEDMTHNLLIRIVEYALFGGIIIHAVDGLFLTLANRKARPIGYAVNKGNENSTWFSRNMGLTGSVILFFLIIHLRTFFFAHRFLDAPESMYQSVVIAFKDWWYSAFYILSVLFLGMHLNHGAQSAFKSLGISNKQYAPIFKACGTGFALIMTIGFGMFPILFFFEILK